MLRFKVGQVFMTRGIDNAVDNNSNYKIEILDSLIRYIHCDWGDLCDEDKEANELAIQNNDRILATYTTSCGKIYIITESNRSYTTVMFANEY